MIVPASAVRFVFSGPLINVQSLESVAFSFSWHPGATGWQDFGLDNNSETMFCASKKVLVKVLKEEYAKRCCWIMLREKIVTLLIMTTE